MTHDHPENLATGQVGGSRAAPFGCGEKEGACGVSAQSETGVASQLLGGGQDAVFICQCGRETVLSAEALAALRKPFAGEGAIDLTDLDRLRDGRAHRIEDDASKHEPPVPAKQALQAPPVEASADTPHAPLPSNLEPATSVGEWLPIETAPKEEWLWVFCLREDPEDGPMLRAKYTDGGHYYGWYWHDSGRHELNREPTHWQPLPEPPVPAKQALQAPPVEASADRMHDQKPVLPDPSGREEGE